MGEEMQTARKSGESLMYKGSGWLYTVIKQQRSLSNHAQAESESGAVKYCGIRTDMRRKEEVETSTDELKHEGISAK